jgi:hypothetical protein
MALRENNRCAESGRPTPDVLQSLHQQDADGLNDALKLALDGAQTALDRYGEVVLAAHRRFAVLRWRGTLPLRAPNDGTSPLIAQRAVTTYLAHAAELAEIATKLQLECVSIF